MYLADCERLTEVRGWSWDENPSTARLQARRPIRFAFGWPKTLLKIHPNKGLHHRCELNTHAFWSGVVDAVTLDGVSRDASRW